MSKPYPRYEESGIDWLGHVPSHWRVTRLRKSVRFFTGWTPPSGQNHYYGGSNRWANISDLSSRELFETGKTVTDEAVKDFGMTVSPRGSLLFSFKLSVGAVSFAGRDLYTNEAIATFPPQEGISLSFAYWSFPLFVRNASENIYGAKMLNQQTIRSAIVALPPLPEQKAIAAFLDRETGKIDALVAEQRRLIELLKEKRQAVISHAVTKGLDPAAPMKPSGIDWLGDIPAHWEVVPLKRVAPTITVGVVVEPTQYVSEEGLPFIYGADIREGVISFGTSRRIAAETSKLLAKTMLRAGDLLTVRVGAPGVTAVVPPACEGGNCASVMLMRRGSHPSEWLCYAMNSRVIRYQVELVQYGAAQEQFNISHAVEFVVPLPPETEAEEIAAALDEQTRRIDALIGEVDAAVRLLQERRSALISAAVTGKIDVRGLAPEATEAA
jgi:type I restriction enzyme, S subunit